MRLGKLIEVHSNRPRYILCEVCDAEYKPDAVKWWEYSWESTEFNCEMTGTCLECCKHKGTVTDWREE